MNADWIFVMEVFGEVFGGIDRAMLSAGTTETNLQMIKTAFDKPLYMVIHQGIDMIQESQDLAVLLKEIYHRLIKTREGFVLLVFTGIMGRTAIKDISATISGLVCRNTAFKGERVNRY